VLPVRFAAFQLLLLLPAHPWQLFLRSPDLFIRKPFILKLLHPARIVPIRSALSVTPFPEHPGPPDILTGSHSPSWRCPLTRPALSTLLHPEAFPCSTVLVFLLRSYTILVSTSQCELLFNGDKNLLFPPVLQGGA